jgi:hypothetical protein
MTLTDRDKRLVVLLPGLALLVGYLAWFMATGKSSAIAQAQAGLEKAEKAVPADDALRLEQAKFMAALREAQRLARVSDEATKLLHQQMACIDPKFRAERMQRLTSLLNRHAITVIEHGDAGPERDQSARSTNDLFQTLFKGSELDRSNSQPTPASLSQARTWDLADAVRKRLPLPHKDNLQLHRIRFHGRYHDVMQAASALSKEGAVAIPVSLTMNESHNYSEWHEWLMLVWV